MRRLIGIAIVLALGLVVAGVAFADSPGRRVALVIGNGAYVTTGSLKNPVGDASLISAALKKSGFEVVDTDDDLGVGPFRAALRKFQSAADGAEAAVVYYAGHGIEARGKNWLIPTDAVLQSDADLEYEAIDLDLVLHATEGAQMRIVVLDACRNNPFGKNWKRGARAVEQGLAETDADDVLIIYSAAPGQTASDGSGANSPFAVAMAQRLPQAGLPVQLLGGMVRDDVLKATADRQRPFVSASITGTPFFFVQGNVTVNVAQPHAPPAAASAFDPRAMELEMWRSVEASDDLAQLKAYLARYPKGEFADVAKAKVARLEHPASRPAVVAAGPQSGAPSAPRGTGAAGAEGSEPSSAPLRLARPHLAILLESTSQSNLDCSSSGTTRIVIVKPPSHGTVTIRHGYRYPNFAPNNARYKCNFQQVAAENVYYMPSGSTVSEDEVVIRVSFTEGSARNYAFNIAPDSDDDPEISRLRANPKLPFERPSPEAEGKVQNTTAYAGLRNVVFASFSVSPDCKSQPYSVLTVRGGAKHGVTQITQETAHAVFAEGHPYFKCDGTSINPTRLYYTPSADYAGSDAISLDVKMPSGRKYTKTILLNVRAP